MAKDETTTNEIMEFLRDNMVTKGDFDSEIGTIKSTMVTKDYLDDKLSDLRGDLSVMIRKEDRKLVELISVLKAKDVLSDEDVAKLLALEPFPQTTV